MNRRYSHSFSLLCFALLSIGLAGCSSLGFSTYPVAHFMTNQTKQVLQASPQRPQVPRELAKEPIPVHFLQPGDELLVEAIDGDSEMRLPADQQVSADGSLDLGKFGRVVVASLTLEQTEQQIHQRLSESVEGDFTVNVRMIQPVHRYYVVGEVNSPGAYSLTGYETVLDGILAAGGLTPRASACDALLARPTNPCSCRVTLPVCYRAITQLGDTTTNYQLQPGDRIFVGRQTFSEEFLPCCSKRTCPRCCDQQQACCNPHIADRTTPEFNMIETNAMVSSISVSPSDASGTLEQDDYHIESANQPAKQDVFVEPLRNDSNAKISSPLDGEPSESSPVKSERKAEPNREDGQLDFELPDSPSASE